MVEKLTLDEKKVLLAVAREAIVSATQNQKLPEIDLDRYSLILKENGASFVTLHTKSSGKLRGCIGSLEAYQPLIKDVQVHAVAAALEDNRFPPVSLHEVEDLHIEISRLTAPIKLHYSNMEELPALLKSGVNGVIIKDGIWRATFLPQVWQQLPDPEIFLDHLCSKMGANPKLWRTKILDVFTYEVEDFHE
jgi:AmmeMemoRadiSam system protein A